MAQHPTSPPETGELRSRPSRRAILFTGLAVGLGGSGVAGREAYRHHQREQLPKVASKWFSEVTPVDDSEFYTAVVSQKRGQLSAVLIAPADVPVYSVIALATPTTSRPVGQGPEPLAPTQTFEVDSMFGSTTFAAYASDNAIRRETAQRTEVYLQADTQAGPVNGHASIARPMFTGINFG